MSEKYSGFFQAKIISYNDNGRTARVSIPTVTDGIDEGITATFAYPVGHDDRDTEIEILEGADCYIFFQQNDPSSPVIWAYSSHGVGAVVDYRRIRQENIELLARTNINLSADDTIHLMAKNVIIDAEVVTVNTKTYTVNGDSTHNGGNTVTGESDLQGETKIQGKPFLGHGHKNVQNGDGESGGVV